MINDIYAMTMQGHYHRSVDGAVAERGTWSYRGYGNAEIELVARAEVSHPSSSRFEVRLHSVERQIDGFDVSHSEPSVMGDGDSSEHQVRFKAVRVGMFLNIEAEGLADHTSVGGLELAPETLFDGPSPVWMIHLLMTAMPPADREVTAPVVHVRIDGGAFETGYYRVARSDDTVRIALLDDDGADVDKWTVRIAEDGCPEQILGDNFAVEIVRTPHAATTEPGSTQ